MAFELKDFERNFTPKGDNRGVFNAVREDYEDDGKQYFAFMNEAGSYVIQRTTTAGTGSIRIHEYYAVGKKPLQFATDWAGRASLSYVEFYNLFPQ